MNSIHRRQFLKNTVQLGAMASIQLLPGSKILLGKETPPSQKPNIVFIIADDMGWADIGYQNPAMLTPHLDTLAKEGARLTHHYAAPTCTPTRVGIMTGHYPSRYGVTGPDYGQIFRDDTITLAAALRRAGYYTAISGKWHMGSPPEWTPLRYGFDSSYGYFHGQVDPYTHLYKTGVRTWHRNDQYIEETGHVTDLITEEAVRIIEAKRNSPFFLYVAYSVPHFPLDEPEEWLSLYKEEKEPSRRWFNASVSHMDHGIGRIVDALDRTGIRENTLIVFVSDNGGQKNWHSADQYKGRYADKPHTVLGNNQPLKGWKGAVYEGGIRVPAFLNWKGHLREKTIEAPIHAVDWMPTLCQLTDASPSSKQRFDGINVWPYITGIKKADPSRVMYWKTGSCKAVRKGDWKLIQFQNTEQVELYNLAADPYEKQDLAKDKSSLVNELQSILVELEKDDRPKL